MALIPKQTKAETKLMWGLTLNRFAGVFTTMIMSMLVGGLFPRLKLPFMILCIGLYLFLCRKAPTNPKKRYWQGMLTYFYYLTHRKKYISMHSDDYEKTIQREADRNELKIQKAQEAKDAKEAAATAKRNNFITRVAANERKVRYKARKKQERKDKRLARRADKKNKKENKRKSSTSE